MKDWLSKNGLKTDTLGKKAVAELLEDAPDHLAEVLKLRQQLAKSSVKKYAAMENVVCSDSRARGMFQFYGANRTGRFAGRLVQLQNLPQNHMPDLKEARAVVKGGDYETLEMLYEDIPDTLSQLIRTAFVPDKGKKFIVADFSAIEARVLSWLAGETWRSKVFESGGDIYCASASQMFKVPVEKHGVNAELRQKGKIAELALGYGGSVGALKAMGALEMGLLEEELKPLVNAWRGSNPNIVKFWWGVDRAVKKCIKEKRSQRIYGMEIHNISGMLFIVLPSGRRLSYVKPRIGENKFGGESVTYEGVGGTKKWERIESYGPKFVENIVQAISRDILMYAMKTLGTYRIVAHVHDEVIIEVDPQVSVESICNEMGKVPSWAPGLILSADGYECDFYKKD
jgi:DNA polymerase